MAAGEITAPSLLARDVHKLCITFSGAHTRVATASFESDACRLQQIKSFLRLIKRYRSIPSIRSISVTDSKTTRSLTPSLASYFKEEGRGEKERRGRHDRMKFPLTRSRTETNRRVFTNRYRSSVIRFVESVNRLRSAFLFRYA